MAFSLLIIFIYLVFTVIFYAKKRDNYSHFKHSISELGESGSRYEKQVSYGIFLPVGLGAIIVAFSSYANHYHAAYISGAIGLSYFLSAFFPCDTGTPSVGSWKNMVHNIVGGVCYATMAYHLNELMDSNGRWYISLSLSLLCSFLVMFIIGFPKAVIGLAQRLAETSLFLSACWLLF